MPGPALESFAKRIYDSLEPLTYDEDNQNYALANFVAALGGMFQVIDDYARDQIVNGEVAPGWSQLLDINRCPSEALGFLGQFVGVPLQAGLSDAAQRDRITGTAGFRRGSPGAIVAAAQQYLTGSQTVIVRERDPAASPSYPAYGLTVITYTSETPDPSEVLAALMDQKPAGIILNYQTHTGQDYQSLYVNNASYQAVYTKYATYQGLLLDMPGA